jgi:hypothetical protein
MNASSNTVTCLTYLREEDEKKKKEKEKVVGLGGLLALEKR